MTPARASTRPQPWLLAALLAAAPMPAVQACMAYTYEAGPPRAAVVESFAQVESMRLQIEMAAGGQTTLLLPLPDARAQWEVQPVSRGELLVRSSVLRGEAKQRLSRHVFDFASLNPLEVVRLSEPGGIRQTRWRDQRAYRVPLKLTYRVGAGKPREFEADLMIYPGIEVPVPRTREAQPGQPIPKC